MTHQESCRTFRPHGIRGRDAERADDLRRSRQRRRRRSRGQQSNHIGRARCGTDNTWNITACRSPTWARPDPTPTYYDFDMFQEMSITTGGSDATNPTPGVQLNLVLKKGANTPHGSARYFFENESLQGNNMDPALAKTIGADRGPESAIASNFTEHCGNRTDRHQDYGFELGG